ncbi:conserved membrane hypothetical protein [Desulfamplus magnetovallimortis]|uniref:Uncharacterized protein n=1 Tax=Desulfamplus magnetovallimortis TaxID=1246637 RepID=A0A1W1HFR0_9BACT|nr:hypothetical protein [Desulfamplus magnetovallimortis]SLM31222.1 conserved membrane hypothetical protein [Desulfamplus magnetovallimortis]
MALCYKSLFWWLSISLIVVCCMFPSNTMGSEPSGGIEVGADNQVNPDSKTLSPSQNKLAALADILDSMVLLQKELELKKKELKNAETEEKKQRITDEMNEIITRLDSRENEFKTIAVGIQPQGDISKPLKIVDLKEEIQEIFRPFIEELKDITSHPREIEKLRKEIAFYEKHLAAVQQGISNTSVLIKEASDNKVKKRLAEIEKQLHEKEKDVQRHITQSQYQLDQKIESKKSIVKVLQGAGDDFFKTRGINLLLSVVAFFVVFIMFRFFYWWIFRSRRANSAKERSFYSRLFEVIYHVFTFFLAVSASLLLLYNFGDWMLLSVAMIFLIGVAWTTKNGFAMFWEQAKFILNIGTVRDGERLIYDGVPWKVVSLNLLTTLENPELAGGVRRLPLQALMGLQSRPFVNDELWFPTRKNDYVVLADGSFGRVIMQSPEMVNLEVLGGCVKTYPCSSFLDQNPINLSMNSFGIGVTFGIDYDHQADITRDIPAKIYKTVSEEIVKREYGEHLLDLLVEFKEAAASSLDILIFVKFAGPAAEFYYMIGRAVQSIVVDACNKNGWGIPFTQITVHNAQSAIENPCNNFHAADHNLGNPDK